VSRKLLLTPKTPAPNFSFLKHVKDQSFPIDSECRCDVSLTHPAPYHRAYNNMLYLIEKYAPLEGLPKYDPQKDPSVTGAGVRVIGQK
jgi:hypothetical protein